MHISHRHTTPPEDTCRAAQPHFDSNPGCWNVCSLTRWSCLHRNFSPKKRWQSLKKITGAFHSSSIGIADHIDRSKTQRNTRHLHVIWQSTALPNRHRQHLLSRNGPLPGCDVGEDALDCDDDKENDTFSSCVALGGVSVFEATELDAIALLADTWDSGLDPEVSAQLVQANVQACLSFGKVKGKGKGKGKGKFLVRPPCLPLEDRRQPLREMTAKTECHACGRKGHWAHDRECAVSPSSLSSKTQTRTSRMTTQLHLSSRPKKVTTCFVLNDCGDDSETLANIAVQNVPLPTESTGQTLLTPIASTASTAVHTRTGSIFDVRAVDNDDEQWLSETNYKSGWNTRFKSGTSRGMLYGVIFARLSECALNSHNTKWEKMRIRS